MPTQIVVLDGFTLCPTQSGAAESTASDDGISWRRLESLGELTVYDRSDERQIIDRAKNAAIVLTNKTPLSAKTLELLPALRYIGVLATGVNVVDLEAARQHQVVVTNIPGYGSDSVAQHVFALLLELINHTSTHDRAVHDGQWCRCPDFSMTVMPITELAGKTLAIVGLGAIGRRVALIGSALGMRIAAATHTHRASSNQLSSIPVRWLPLEELASVADVLTLHCPLNEKTRLLINGPLLAKMKPSAVVINTGRGELVDEPALAKALQQQKIAGAGLDVLGTEPPKTDNPLLSVPNCVITPHVAWASIEAKQRLMNQAVDNVKAFLDGTPVNVVSGAPNPAEPQPKVPPPMSKEKSINPSPSASVGPPTNTILLIAAIAEELMATVHQLGLKKEGEVYTGQLGTKHIIAALIGPGATNAKTATNRLVDQFTPDAVILFGLAGGLDPRFPEGTVLPITWVIDERGWAIHLDHDVESNIDSPYAQATVKLSDERQRQTTEQSLVTLDRLADTVATKRQLFEHYRCSAADMETFHVAHSLAQKGIPLVILRAIGDPADMALPAATINWIKPDGHTNVLAVLRHLLIHPWRTFTLIRLGKNTRLAAQQLAHHVESILRDTGE